MDLVGVKTVVKNMKYGSKRFMNGSVSTAKKNPVKVTQPSMII